VRGFIESGSAEIVSESELHDAGFDWSIFRNVNRPEDL
jgi:hypothetical protein